MPFSPAKQREKDQISRVGHPKQQAKTNAMSNIARSVHCIPKRLGLVARERAMVARERAVVAILLLISLLRKLSKLFFFFFRITFK